MFVVVVIVVVVDVVFVVIDVPTHFHVKSNSVELSWGWTGRQKPVNYFDFLLTKIDFLVTWDRVGRFYFDTIPQSKRTV